MLQNRLAHRAVEVAIAGILIQSAVHGAMKKVHASVVNGLQDDWPGLGYSPDPGSSNMGRTGLAV
jgi:hypothetical protein